MKISSNILFTIIIFIIVASACKKDKDRELTEDNCVFISQTLNENNEKWEMYLDTFYSRDNINNYSSGAFFSEIYNPINIYENYLTYNYSFQPDTTDSVLIGILSNFRIATPVITTLKHLDLRFYFKVNKNEFVLKNNNQFYFNSFSSMINLFSQQNLKIGYSSDQNKYIHFTYQDLEKVWTLGTIGDTSDLNNNNKYYFRITDTQVNSSEEKIYVTIEYKLPVSNIAESKTSLISGKAKVLIVNLRF